MNLQLKRYIFTPKSTTGHLFVNDVFQCYTLEDVVRAPGEPKVYGETAIPEGRYRVAITWSPRFQQNMPLLHDVPGFEGVRIHPGNKPEDTEGCILVGHARDKDWIGGSRDAYAALYNKLLTPQLYGEEIWLTVRKMEG